MSERFKHLELRESEHTLAESATTTAGCPVRTAGDDHRHAVEAVHTGRFETALQLYTRALREDRGFVPAWTGQVQMLIQLDECAEARLWSDKALELFLSNGELLGAKAQACARLGDHKAAMASSDAALQSPGSSAARWQSRGEVLLPKDARLARDCFDKSLAEADADWFDRALIAMIYLYHRKSTVALEFAQAAVELKPSQPFSWTIRARCQEALGWFEQAATSYEHGLELAPGNREIGDALFAIQARTPPQRVLGWLGGLFKR